MQEMRGASTAFITLANAKQAARDPRSLSHVKALTHAYHGVCF